MGDRSSGTSKPRLERQGAHRGGVCRFLVGGVLLLMPACTTDDPPDIPSRYGLHQATLYREVVERAIVLADEVLPPDMPLRLRPTWPQAGYFPLLYFVRDRHRPAFAVQPVKDRGFDNGLRFKNAQIIYVYIVDDASLGRVENIFVPDKERCIFVSAKSLDRLFESFFITGPRALQQLSSFEKSLVVALILLHELGHLHFNDGGSYGPPARLNLDEMSRPSRDIANREVRADRFATEILEQAWDSHKMKGSIPGLFGRAVIANHIYRVIATGSNTYDFRVDPQGLLDKIVKRHAFNASGYSHLNLYLRLLVMLYQLNPTDERLADLQAINALFVAGSKTH
jgi:hypothetical protein